VDEGLLCELLFEATYDPVVVADQLADQLQVRLGAIV